MNMDKDKVSRSPMPSESIAGRACFTQTAAATPFGTETQAYRATALSIRDRLIESFNDTCQHFDEADCKRAYYLSIE